MTPRRFAAVERSCAVAALVMSFCSLVSASTRVCGQVGLAARARADGAEPEELQRPPVRERVVEAEQERAGSAGRMAGERQSPMCERCARNCRSLCGEGALPCRGRRAQQGEGRRQPEQDDCGDEGEGAAEASHAADSGTRRELSRSLAASSPMKTRPTASSAHGEEADDRLDPLLRRLREGLCSDERARAEEAGEDLRRSAGMR